MACCKRWSTSITNFFRGINPIEKSTISNYEDEAREPLVTIPGLSSNLTRSLSQNMVVDLTSDSCRSNDFSLCDCLDTNDFVPADSDR